MSHYRWLIEQLPDWEREGVLAAEAAEKLRLHAEAQIASGIERRGESRVAQIVMGALGALLVGTGLIALIGHNWDQIPREWCLAGSFLVLALAQGWVAWVIKRGAAASRWAREACALLLVLAAGGCLALVSQIYNMGGDWPQFLFVWVVLALPVLWSTGSHACAVFHFLCIGIWAVSRMEIPQWSDSPWLYPILLLTAFPYWPKRWRHVQPLPNPVRWIAAASALAGFGALAFHTSRRGHNLEGAGWLLMLTSAVIAMVPLTAAGIEERTSRKPQIVLGGAVLFALAFAFSHTWMMKDLADRIHELVTIPWFCVLAVAYTALLVVALSQGRLAVGAIASLAITPVFALLFRPESGGVLLSWAFTTHLFLIGLVMILAEFWGAKGAPRLGALLLAMLIMVRLADSELPLLTKAIVFIVTGLGFIAFNLIWSRRGRTVA